MNDILSGHRPLLCAYLALVDIPFVREHYFVHYVWTFPGTCLVMHVVILRVCINQHLEGHLAALFGTRTNLDVITAQRFFNPNSDLEP